MVNKLQFGTQISKLIAVGFAALTLTACGGSDKIDLQSNGNVGEAIEAATGPLQDLNLRRQEIPPILVTAAMNPYARLKKIKCTDIQAELAALDEVLGPDMKPKTYALASSEGGLVGNIATIPEGDDGEKLSLADGAGSLAKDAIMGTIRSKTNILPFRGIIRSVTGANRHQKKLAAAYDAGKLRRAYLKGLADVRFGDRCPFKPVVVEAKATTTVAQ